MINAAAARDKLEQLQQQRPPLLPLRRARTADAIAILQLEVLISVLDNLEFIDARLLEITERMNTAP